MPTRTWKTAITKIEPNKIVIRGYRLDQLMGKFTYPQVIYLLIKGELPTKNVGRILDAILVSCVDHGVTAPSAQAAVTVASSGAPLNAALAAGILAFSEYHGGTIEKAMKLLEEAVHQMRSRKLSAEQVAHQLVENATSDNQPLPGFGHRYHTCDPRSRRLLELAEEHGISSRYIEMVRTIQQALQEHLRKEIAINIDGAIAAVLCELNIPAELANAFFLMARIPGLLAHIYEEQTRYQPMRSIDFSAVEYDGPEEREI